MFLAPNGKKSNLTPEQYKLVRTPEFKAWFGDWENDKENSGKVSGITKEPVVWYHSTKSNFITKKGENIFKNPPFFFGLRKDISEDIVKIQQSQKKGKIYTKPFFVRYKNTFDITKANILNDKKLANIIKKITLVKTDKDLKIFQLKLSLPNSSKNTWSLTETKEMQDYIKENGYDSFFVYEDGAKNLAVFSPEQIKLADGSNTTFDANNPDIRFKKGGRTISQTPAPKKDRIVGSKVNPKGSASSEKSAEQIKLSTSIIVSLTKKLNEFKETHKTNKVSLSDLKAVYRRGLGAYSKSHRPTISGGKPNSRNAWAMARVNAFLRKASDGESKKAYVQDDDLLKMHLGGDMSKHLAPNGKPSNLTHEQWHLVRTPEFKAWFGDWEKLAKIQINDSGIDDITLESLGKDVSKVVDENGEPLVVYRGTTSTTQNVSGLWLSKTKGYAESFGNIIEYFVKIINPMPEDLFNRIWMVDFDTYDGRLGDFHKIVVKHPTQIKLADGSNTTFDSSNPDIRYADGGEVNDCINYIKDNQSVFNNGYYFDMNDLSKVIDPYGQVPLNLDFTLVSYNSGGQKNLDVIDTINPTMLVDKLSELLGISKNQSYVVVHYVIKRAKRLTNINQITTQKIVVVDRDMVVCENLNQQIKCRRCGWEWNTKDSEEFDKYVCHNCGFDNRTFYDVDPIGYKDGGEIDDYKFSIVIRNIKNPEDSYKSVKNKYRGAYEKIFNILNDDSIFTEWETTDEVLKGNDFYLYFDMKPDQDKISKIIKIPNVEILNSFSNGGEVDEHKETYAKWKSLVNMSYGELKKFYDSKEGKEAGLSTSEANKQGISSGRESARWIMKMKTTPKDKWTDTMWKWANKQISFISRMSGMQGELFDDKGNKTRKHTSLLIWGHNPKKDSSMKYENGGEIKFDKEFTNEQLWDFTEKYGNSIYSINGKIVSDKNKGWSDTEYSPRDFFDLLKNSGVLVGFIDKKPIRYYKVGMPSNPNVSFNIADYSNFKKPDFLASIKKAYEKKAIDYSEYIKYENLIENNDFKFLPIRDFINKKMADGGEIEYLVEYEIFVDDADDPYTDNRTKTFKDLDEAIDFGKRNYASVGYEIIKDGEVVEYGYVDTKNKRLSKYEDGGEMDVRMEDTVQRMDNPNFADISYYDNGGATDFGKVITSSSRFKPRETIVFDPPLIGTNGNKLISYTWSYEWTEDFNKFKGETVSKRISDWTQAETNAETGRQIVHQYGIQLADGTYKTVSSETVPIILGFLDKKQSSTLPNLVTASKTLAKQKMQLAILEAKKIEEENAIKEIMSKPFPPITKSIAFGDAIRYTMGKVSVIDHNTDIDTEISKERKETLIDAYVREQLKEIGINANDYYKTYELKNRIQRQERKIQNILENKMEDGGELEGLTQSEIDTNAHNIARKFKMPLEYIYSQLNLGIKFEMEHTDDKSIASKIALDHLNESPYYYQKLTEMEKELDTMKMDADIYLPKIMSAYKNGGEVDMIFKLNTPTKQPTKLNYIQQVLVRTTEFKKWFGDWEKCAESFLQDNKNNFLTHYKNCSIVIDLTTLEPQVVYHGTNFKEEFYTFDVTKKEGVGRPYGYFADNIEYSQNFTTNSQRGQHGLELLYKCFLNIRKPFMAIGEEFYNEKDNQFGWSLKIARQIAINIYGDNYTIDQWQDTLKVVLEQVGTYIYDIFGLDNKPFWLLMARDTKKEFKYFLMSHGYDGVRYAEEFKGVYDVDNPAEFTKAWTIFDANQVKLADGRNIDFDPFKEDIRYEEGGSLTELNQEDMQQENMSKAQMLRKTIGINKFAEGGTVKGDGKHSNDAKKGGFFDGRSHAEGGIKAINKDTGQLIEVEGNEVIINKRSVADDTKREFEGKMMTNREILSTINQMGGGVSFKEGGEINEKSCKCMGKKYKFGGNLISDYDIVKELTNSYNDVIKKPISNSINYVENLINKINGNY